MALFVVLFIFEQLAFFENWISDVKQQGWSSYGMSIDDDQQYRKLEVGTLDKKWNIFVIQNIMCSHITH